MYTFVIDHITKWLLLFFDYYDDLATLEYNIFTSPSGLDEYCTSRYKPSYWPKKKPSNKCTTIHIFKRHKKIFIIISVNKKYPVVNDQYNVVGFFRRKFIRAIAYAIDYLRDMDTILVKIYFSDFNVYSASLRLFQ